MVSVLGQARQALELQAQCQHVCSHNPLPSTCGFTARAQHWQQLCYGRCKLPAVALEGTSVKPRFRVRSGVSWHA